MYYFFTEEQKNKYQQAVDAIEYAPFESHFKFIEVKNNLFILPQEIDNKINITNVELREFKESDKINFKFL